MNDQQPHAGYDTYPTDSFDTDPLFGGLPGTGNPSGQYDTSQWDTGSSQHVAYDAYTAHTQQGYDSTGTWSHLGGYPQSAEIPAQGGPASYDTGSYGSTASYDSDATVTGQWDASAWNQADQVHQAHQDPFETGQFDATQFAYAADSSSGHQWQAYDPSLETGSFEASSFDTAAFETASFETSSFETGAFETGAFDATSWNSAAAESPEPAAAPAGFAQQTDSHTTEFPVVSPDDVHPHAHDAGDSGPGPEPEPAAVGPRAARRVPASRGRRRPPAKRSALLTVAVPSACVMGVAGIAAASVGGIAGADEAKPKPTTMAAADPATVKPVAVNNKLDTQLAGLSADARDFGDRASRTQERIDLKERQDAEKKRKAEEAARKEAARPKYALPVAQHGLSAYYGQAGVNWAAVHTGIDFPVGLGTPVMAATDGTVSAEFNSAYGNMMKVVSPSGVETWYCHLSTTKIRSGPVKAGDVIGYSGSSGNSTGPHLHFEVRPGGESAVDPLAWYRSRGLDPT
ncbi:peptidoglycan DD-metalloendopeptidase family protein [Streptomyces sp. NPDC048442]|uniref:M23 family metallopeptidase n=1 Tax=Streptomyces sp. NPDC048442 TaxID=3154823 RepID=UPI00344623D9